MSVDKQYYINKFNSRCDQTRDDVVDYIFSFLRRRIDINKEIPVEMIRRHCERTLQAGIPMDEMIGALLYSRYQVSNIDGEWYAGVSWNSPIGTMLQHKRIDKMTLDALHGWYGDLIDPTTGERYDQQ